MPIKYGMKALPWIFIFLAGCQTYSPAELIHAQYKPKREGVLKMPRGNGPDFAKWSKEDASSLMKSFCGNDRPEIVSISKESGQTGSTTTVWAGVAVNEANFSNDTLVKFDCIKSESKDASLEPPSPSDRSHSSGEPQ